MVISMKERKNECVRKLKAQYKGDPTGIASDVMDVAKYIVTKCTIDDRPVNNKNLQITLFVIQRESLIFAGMPMHHGVFEAWEMGPVIQDVYNHYIPDGYIRNLSKDMGLIKGKEFIDLVMQELNEMTAMQFIHASTKVGGAWHTTWTNYKGENKEIPLYLIRSKG